MLLKASILSKLPVVNPKSARLKVPKIAYDYCYNGCTVATTADKKITFSEMFTNVDMSTGKNSFYCLVILRCRSGFKVLYNWGRTGGALENESSYQMFRYGGSNARTVKVSDFSTFPEAVKAFESKYFELTGWRFDEVIRNSQNCQQRPGRYRRVILDDGILDEDDMEEEDEDVVMKNASGDDDTISVLTTNGRQVSDLKVKELKIELQQMGKPIKGKKAVLAAALTAAILERVQLIAAASSASSSSSSSSSAVVTVMHEEVRNLINHLFDRKLAQDSMKEQGLDVKELPLGTLSKRMIKQGYQILSLISDAIRSGTEEENDQEEDDDSKQNSGSSSGGSSSSSSSSNSTSNSITAAKLIDLNNQFYQTIPFTMKRGETGFKIDTLEQVKVLSDLVDQLNQIRISESLMQNVNKSNTNQLSLVQSQYQSLNCTLLPIDGGKTFRMVEEYVQMGGGPGSNLILEELYSVERAGEQERYINHLKKSKGKHTKTLLWHGSRVTNFVGLLSQGLRIAPPEAPATGYLLGKGCYFANLISKSLHYCGANTSDDGNGRDAYLALCEVAVEKQSYKTLEHDGDAREAAAAMGVETTEAYGRVAPDETTWDTLDGACLPKGIHVPRQEDCDLFVKNNTSYLSPEECYERLNGNAGNDGIDDKSTGGKKRGRKKKKKPTKKKPKKKQTKKEKENEQDLRQRAEQWSRRTRSSNLAVDEVVVYNEALVCIRYLCKVKIM